MMIEDAEEAYGDSMMRGYDDDEGHEDILNFKDSERESLISYMHSTAALDNKYGQALNMIDTPTRLVNESNEFLEMQLARKRKTNPNFKTLMINASASKNSRDDDSSLENTLRAAGTTLSSLERKKKQMMKEEFLKIVSEVPKPQVSHLNQH
jgi:hypothetical protein